MTSFDLYTKTSVIKLFFIVAIPGAVSMLASSLWSVFDSIFVGRFIGEMAFAAMNLSIPFVFINNSLADLIGVGSSVPISIALGKGERDKANNYFTCACITIVVLGAISGAVLFCLAPFILRTMGADGELLDLGVIYLRTFAVFSPFTTIIYAMDNFLRICGKIKSSMALNILMSAIILASQIILIAVLKIGIMGSPIAASTGMLICAIIALIPFIRKKLTLQFCCPRFSFGIVRQFASSGFPNFLSNMASRITSILMNTVLLQIGGTGAVSVYGILMNAGDIVQQFLYGSCDSLQPAIGYNWGNRQVKRVLSIMKCSLTASAAISIAGMFIMQLFPEFISSAFLDEESRDLIPMAVNALRLFSLANLLKWFPFAIQGFLIALDKPAPASILSILNTFVVPIVLLFAMYPIGLPGIWLNAALTSIIVSFIATVIIHRLKKQGTFRIDYAGQ